MSENGAEIISPHQENHAQKITDEEFANEKALPPEFDDELSFANAIKEMAERRADTPPPEIHSVRHKLEEEAAAGEETDTPPQRSLHDQLSTSKPQQEQTSSNAFQKMKTMLSSLLHTIRTGLRRGEKKTVQNDE